MAVGSVGSAFGVGEEILKEDSGPSEIKLFITQDGGSEAFPTFSPFPAATNPWRYARSDQRITNQISARAMRPPGIMDVKESYLLAQIYTHPKLLDHVGDQR